MNVANKARNFKEKIDRQMCNRYGRHDKKKKGILNNRCIQPDEMTKTKLLKHTKTKQISNRTLSTVYRTTHISSQTIKAFKSKCLPDPCGTNHFDHDTQGLSLGRC